jgi:LmbE family N-acetylglucosaminyl deacetylase
MAGSSAPVLHVSPHPDDELMGAPATLTSLRDAGSRVINLACSLGRPDQRARRRRELEDAINRVGFVNVVHEPPLATSRAGDLVLAQRTLTDTIRELLHSEPIEIVVSPSPHDGHPWHEVVARATRDALRTAEHGPAAWWMWGLWADLPLPTLYVPFDDRRLAELEHALEAYAGELARNDYITLLRTRAQANRVLGAERVFGFGSEARDGPYAELLTEVMTRDGGWELGAARTPSMDQPLSGARGVSPIDWWLDAPSVADRARQAQGATTLDRTRGQSGE